MKIKMIVLIGLIMCAGCGGGGSSPASVSPAPAPVPVQTVPEKQAQTVPDRWPSAAYVDCSTIIDPVVIVVAGQSQVTNHVPDKNNSYQGVYSGWYVNGSFICVRAVDPLPGSLLTNGTIASRLADRLLLKAGGRPIMVLNYGVGGTTIAQWLPGTVPNTTLMQQIDGLTSAGFAPDALLWMQGESDCYYGTTQAQYASRFATFLQSIREHTNAPVMVAIETWVDSTICQPVRAAQLALPNASLGAYRGPDLDNLDNSYRRDGTHWSTLGADTVADWWDDYM